MQSEKPPTVLFWPSSVYEVAQLVFFPLNYAIGALCHLQPGSSVWDEDGFEAAEVRGSGRALDDVARAILEERDVAHDEADLVRLYDSLPTVSARRDLVGRAFRGRILRTGRSVLDLADRALVRPLGKLGLGWGKRYRTRHVGDPLLVRWANRVYFPIPIWGNVGMTDIAWRGASTATMNYDRQPWKDYFKLLSDEGGRVVLLGVWTHKHIAGGWFTLTLDETYCAHVAEAKRPVGATRARSTTPSATAR